MKIAWTEDAWQDYLHWQQRNEKILAAINALIKDIKHYPFKGLGKPEPLNTRCRAGGRAASQANTVWSIAYPLGCLAVKWIRRFHTVNSDKFSQEACPDLEPQF
jgi:hypothetical protein